MTRNQVDSLLQGVIAPACPRSGAQCNLASPDVVIEIEKHSDGTLLVLPARAS